MMIFKYGTGVFKMKKTLMQSLLVAAALMIPAYASAETYIVTQSDGQTRVAEYKTIDGATTTTTYSTIKTVPFYNAEGFVSEDNRTVIQAMQQALRDTGFYKLGEVNGIWTQRTADALFSYQKANGLRPTAKLDYPTGQSLGMIMPATNKDVAESTRAPAPNSTTLHSWMTGRTVIQDPPVVFSKVEHTGRPVSDPKIQDLQQALADAGFYKDKVDGLYGPKTTAAVKSYQASNGLAVTGTMTKQTVLKLGMAESDMDKDLTIIAPAAGN
jgi:peptidoglycan hydrolase-like protein with peptidoglycan-binding domain